MFLFTVSILLFQLGIKFSYIKIFGFWGILQSLGKELLRGHSENELFKSVGF